MSEDLVRPAPDVHERLRSRDNALNFIRLLLALGVILSHSSLVGGFDVPSPLGNGEIGRWSVNGFFAISGFLVAGSRTRMGMRPYLWRRGLRIMPGYWVVLVMTAFVIAPVSTLMSGESIDGGSALRYVAVNSLLVQRQWNIEATLLSVPFPHMWNIPLWTLFWEAVAYLLAGTMLSLSIVRRRPMIVTLCVLAAATVFLLVTSVPPNPIRLISYFLAGMALCFKLRLPVSHKLAVGCVALLVGLSTVGLHDLASQLPLTYLLLYLGSSLSVRVGASNDISYGTYIYAFPVQQTLAVAGGHSLGYLGFVATSALLTAPLALLSWHRVERPAMALRYFVPAIENRCGRVTPSPSCKRGATDYPHQ